MSEQAVFNAAEEYDFFALREHALSGGDINITDTDGISLFARFLYGYYTAGEPAATEPDENSFETFLSDELRKPLDKRGGILEKVDWFFEMGADADLCEIVEDAAETPLSVAVQFEDYFMVEYLLSRGADPKTWLTEEGQYYADHETWLIDHIDEVICDYQGDRGTNVYNIGVLLCRHGLDDYDYFNDIEDMTIYHI